MTPAAETGVRDKAGFDIGWDYALHGVALSSDAPACVRDGHRAGLAHFRGRPARSDRFVLK